MNNKNVLLTGASGFLGTHTVIQLLEKGYHVLGTLREMERASSIRTVIAKHTDKIANLSFAEADLEDSRIWPELTAGADYVIHTASPFPRELPSHEDELIVPAVNGVLNVLKASANAGIKRVVITSSAASIIYGKIKENRNGTFSEDDWTDEAHEKDLTPYIKSKTLAEKAAWNFVEKDNSGMELVTICPGAILGPVLEDDFGTSANIIIKTLDGSSPALPDIGFEIVDVRSVAALHIKAMELPAAANQRYIAANGYLKFKDVAAVLKSAYPAMKIPRAVMPNVFVRWFSRFDTALKPILIDLGKTRKLDSSKARKELNWTPISNEKAILSCAKSVLELGLIKRF
ncbi:SDR family oxidoreductase [Parapedobacter deserti]|uniref:SDR family oxidoreductase n=1 Tax=Parapedobacter deserti TaxID=1912957 RepID=A0ABV7JIL4_9SPHI